MSFLLDPWVDRTLSSSDMNMLHGDSQLVIVAGSDTTSATLVCALHELTKLPDGIPQLRSEMESLLQAGKPISNQNLHSLAFLNGVINETLRLYPPAGMLPRLTPPEGLDIGGTHIPGNTTVICPFYSLGRSEAIYVRPEEFCPQRWYEYPETVKEKSAFAPFSTGEFVSRFANIVT
ncbi:MAG: hypothetical protein LQ350_004716 [Teloschistes chrysophthalmus]|nr:MAG: hypothetical protein LQ350_004716 [Niorma chrysophthalma]